MACRSSRYNRVFSTTALKVATLRHVNFELCLEVVRGHTHSLQFLLASANVLSIESGAPFHRHNYHAFSLTTSLFFSLWMTAILILVSKRIKNRKCSLQICTGQTGHAEVIQLKYDASKVSPTDLLEIFFKMHDPTTKNRQGADVGTQYRRVEWGDTIVAGIFIANIVPTGSRTTFGRDYI